MTKTNSSIPPEQGEGNKTNKASATIEIKKSEIAQKEEKILEFWNTNEIFKKSLEKESPNGNFVFYDGPPFATGLPHYGHVLPGTMKDVIPRYKTMQGGKVLRRWGWDCHGLPIENLIEKELDLKSKKDIEMYGVEKFNAAARNAVFRYSDEWKKIIPRVGRWVDMENAYTTMDSTYTESVWWSFKTLYDKGLVYQAFKSMLLCPHCETTLSNFEVNQGYKDITDISVYVKFALVGEENTFVLAWTTTPWTLPGNFGLAINKEAVYVKVTKDGANYVLAKELAQKVLKENYKIVEEFSGEKLLGKSYLPVFDYYNNDKLENRENAWKIYAGDFVTLEDGTGVVHIAPAFGEDDMNLGKENKLPFIQHVNRDGTFKSEVIDFAGQKVKPIEDHQKADVEIIKYLAKHGTLFAKEKFVHSYPHCWRCSTPLLNYATTSWFVKVTDLKDRMVEVNKKVSWVPEEIGDGRFGKWLEGARDWAISRSRYWGAPLPMWQNAKGENLVIGSIEDLKKYTKKSGNKYFVMRHCETEYNTKNILTCNIETPDVLTSTGIAKTKENAEALSGEAIDLIIASPFQRTLDTAKIVADELGLSHDKIVTDDRLVEWKISKEYDLKPIEDFFAMRNKSTDRYHFKTEGGESYMDILRRSGEFMYEIEQKYAGKNILIVSHGGVTRALCLVAVGFSHDWLYSHTRNFKNFDNAEIRQVDFVPLPHNENFELDLHRPYIDNAVLVDESGGALTRVPEIFDTWYDSGSMPYAQQHYPFENKELFEQKNSPLFPADFIAEGLDQTRGWFYTLLVLSVGLFDRSPYEHVLVNGLVLAEDGRKMSKSLKNYPDLLDIVNKYGADSLRYYLMSSPLVKAEDFNFTEKGVEEIFKKLIQKIYNVLSFYEMYPVEGSGVPKETVLDSWILARLNELIKTVTVSLDKYELDRASRPILDFVEDLSTWYVRRSRERFKSDDLDTRYAASYYTRYVLLELSKVMAPFTPFIAEEVYRRVGGEAESVHLETWPKVGNINQELISEMEMARIVVTSALELRQKAGHKVRQPLALLTLPDKFSQELLDIIADEVNVKEVRVVEGEMKLDINLTPELKAEGVARDIIRGIQDARKTEGLSPSDKIKLVVCAGEEVQSVMSAHEEMIKNPTQVVEISYSTDKQKHVVSVDGQEVTLSILK